MTVPPIGSNAASVPNPSQDAQNQVNLIESYLSELNALALEQAQGQDESGAMNTIYQELEGATAALAQDGKSGTGLSADAKNLINLFMNNPTSDPTSTPLSIFLMNLNNSAGYLSVLNDALKQPASTPATNPQLLDAQIRAASLTFVASTVQDLLNMKPMPDQSYFQDQVISLGMSLANQLYMDSNNLSANQKQMVSVIGVLMNDMAKNCQVGNFNPSQINSDLQQLTPVIDDLQSSLG